MRSVATRPIEAARFVDVAAFACDQARALGVRDTWVALQLDGGALALCVDNARHMSDEQRLATVACRQWDIAMLTGGAPDPFVFPLLEPRGAFGLVVCAAPGEIAQVLERDLAMLATRLSVWCVARGIAAVPKTLRLGPRQGHIAQLVARGLSNREIGEMLGITINTVKARLKEVFDRLDVHSRTELTEIMGRHAPFEGIAGGVTHLPTVTVTRAV
jgi:DNA-binding CsgD family transcriptional regulator